MKITAKNKFFLLGFLLVMVGGGLLIVSQRVQNTEQEEVKQVATDSLTFEVVTSEEDQERGLGGREIIPDNYGMLFVFSQKGTPGFWMKDMLAPIDIIWLSDDGTILGIEDRVSPDTYPDAFYPPEPVRFVLETRAGYATEHAWSVGTKVDLPEI